MSSKGKILVIGSSAETFELKDGRKEPVGYYLNEMAIPMQVAVDAGYEIVLATPKGGIPLVDKNSVDVSHFGGSEEALQKALHFVATHPAMLRPRSIRSVIDEGLDDYVGVFTPGGHPPMADLMQDPDLGEVLRYFHETAKPTGLLCHGPIAAIAAMPQSGTFRQAMVDRDKVGARAAAQGWSYAGYNMTIFSNAEEYYVEENFLDGSKVPFYVADALEVAGSQVTAKGFFEPNVVQDRELITGQNPPSDHAMAEAFIEALDRYVASAHTV
jgi:putative intracellular protease/amidase